MYTDVMNLLSMKRLSEISRVYCWYQERNRSHARKILVENDVVSEKLLGSRFGRFQHATAAAVGVQCDARHDVSCCQNMNGQDLQSVLVVKEEEDIGIPSYVAFWVLTFYFSCNTLRAFLLHLWVNDWQHSCVIYWQIPFVQNWCC